MFRKALSEALLSSDLTVNINGAPVRAADTEVVRTEFYAIFVAKGETKASSGIAAGRHSTALWTRPRRKTLSESGCYPADRR